MINYNTMQGEKNVQVKKRHKIYLYYFGDKGMIFNEYNSIASAVRDAIKIPGSYIICDGQVLEYRIVSPTRAIYMQGNGRVKNVDLINY